MAAEFLQKKGFTIISRNFACRQGEIDIIAKDGETYVFIEVKYRRDTSFGLPEEAVTKQKRRHLFYCAKYFLYEAKLPEETKCRFDVVSILGKQIYHIEDIGYE